MHCPYPIDPGKWSPLGIGDGYDWDFSKFLVQRDQIGEIEPAMQCRQARNLLATGKRKMQIIRMKVDEVELFRLAKDLLHHQYMMREGIDRIGVQPQRFLAGFHEVSVGYRIAARKQSDLVAQCHETFRKPGNNSFGPSIVSRRNTLIKWRNLGNPHPLGSFATATPVVALQKHTCLAFVARSGKLLPSACSTGIMVTVLR
jgi:hypothetical protein